MKHPSSSLGLAAVLGALAVVTPGLAAHNGPDLTEDEVQCQLRSQYVMASFARRYTKCLSKCAKSAGSNALAAATCPEVSACTGGPANATCRCLVRARDQAAAGQELCTDCPECYADGACEADATSKTDALAAWGEALFFFDSPSVYCDDSSSGDGLHVAEAKCQIATAKALTFFARAKLICLRQCRLDEHDGVTPPGSCDAPLSSNPNASAATEACIDRLEVKTALKIDKRCGFAGNPPECWNGRTSMQWVALVEQMVDDTDDNFFCGSPSPAFLD
jgi:hypothetical protein